MNQNEMYAAQNTENAAASNNTTSTAANAGTNGMKTPAQLVDAYTQASVNKAKTPIWKFILLAMMAGAFIAIGGSSSSLAAHAVTNPGLAKLVSGCIFPIGLMLIVFIGGELFTGDCMMFMGVARKQIKVLDLIRCLALVWIGNLIGALVIVALVYFAGQWDMSAGGLGAYTIKVAYGKCTISFGAAVCSGIMCNILVCAAVLMGMASNKAAGKIWGIFFPIMAFVVGGYEHCVANMYYIPAGMLAMQNETYVAKAMKLYGLTAEQLAAINPMNFFVTSMIPVVIGNILGGMVFISVPMLLAAKKNK